MRNKNTQPDVNQVLRSLGDSPSESSLDPADEDPQELEEGDSEEDGECDAEEDEEGDVEEDDEEDEEAPGLDDNEAEVECNATPRSDDGWMGVGK
jgi:hypothetical protein